MIQPGTLYNRPMKRASWPLFKLALALALVAFVLSAVLGGCTLRPSSPRATSTVTTLSASTTVAESTTTTKPVKRPTSTSDWRSTTTVSESTSTTSGEAHPTTGDAKAIAAGFKSSVVLVTAIAETNATGYFQLQGTGVVFEQSGSYAYIVTNNHVIERTDGKASTRIRVTLPSGSTVTGTLIGRDSSCDLAVLRVKSKRVVAATFRTDLSELREGDFVVAIGKPKMLKHPVVSGNVIRMGPASQIVQLDETLSGIEDVIDSSAPVVEGFSGGPLLDYKGRVIGINMAKLVDHPGDISLPADFVMEVAQRLLDAAK